MDHNDPLGLYGALGLTPSASRAKIEQAKRRSSLIARKKFGDNLVEGFQRVENACDILNDPVRRANYDRFACTPPENAGGPEAFYERDRAYATCGATRCSRCRKITPQPRQVEFSRVPSFPLESPPYTEGGLYCADCARSAALRNSIHSLIFGSWVPPVGGLLVSICVILANGFGQRRDRQAEDELSLRNAQAFLAAGDRSLACALAESAARSEDVDIARAAAAMLKSLREAAGNDQASPLENPWDASLLSKLPYVLMPLIALLFYAAPLYFLTKIFTYQPPLQFVEVNNVPVQACGYFLQNGEMLKPATVHTRRNNLVRFINQSDDHAIVKVRDVASNSVVVSFFVRGRNDAVLVVPEIKYRLQYSLGVDLNFSCKTLIQPVSWREFGVVDMTDDIHIYVTKEVSEYTSREAFPHVLPPGMQFDQESETISQAEFDRP
ncbi:hypothetical protein ANOBCDAF_03879 [Pleomorphomonas sp. T1.2MG-36]|uniref:hypothetical protein n=1 Tax=Pleomorphomonas sp. T1.2MG-36 TaxID=3041167 RepID=UPI002477B0DF|nr:hypothetical protein [Pleomorphomonas sp. T1.2MG-36]CAI9417054.1 hypothetical protein ANOBCDAF_03879 [Pleomorphomonas sp. T1.2MG-36]